MARTFRLALAQINTTVGDIPGNAAKIVDYIERARALRCDLVAFPELAVTGYPPEDLVFRPHFVQENLARTREIAATTQGITAVYGFVDDRDGLRNAAAIAHDGRLAGAYHKKRLPNYGVFDEARYFVPGDSSPVYRLGGVSFAVNVCEDIWFEEDGDPLVAQSRLGAKLVVTINGSPYHAGKLKATRERLVSGLASRYNFHMAYVNLVGGQDELVFDGASMVFGPDGKPVVRGSQFQEEMVVVDLQLGEAAAAGFVELGGNAALDGVKPAIPPRETKTYDEVGEVYAALALGTRDYVRKCGFTKALVGLSGGVDSALTAAVAADALGPENVVGITMPSRYSSEGSFTDARELAGNLGIGLWNVPIEPAHRAFADMLESYFQDTEPNVAEENVQARIRGNVLMTVSNKFGWIVLTTGNKSEMAMGYATLYGDMAGGFAVLKDVPKTLVYRLCEWRNRNGASGPVIPQAIIDKPPTAELKYDQLDQDTLPPYDLLDQVVKAYVEDECSYQEMVDMKFDPEIVRQVIRAVDLAEYKRRQAPPGVKITPRAFGRDRRLPIVNRYRQR